MAHPLRPAHIIVPNPTVEQFIRFDIAEKTGVAANLHIRLLTSYLAELVRAADPNIQILDRMDLQLLIFTRLQDEAFIAENQLHAIKRYLNHSATRASTRMRGFQLAGELARLLEEYSFSRRPMLANWQRNQRTLGQSARAVEEWQMKLWRALFDSQRRMKHVQEQNTAVSQLSLFGSNPEPYGEVGPESPECMMLVDALDRVNDRLVLPQSLHIFGQSYVAPAFVDTCARLAEKTALYVYALNPCIEFWEDVQASGLSQLQTTWAHRTRRHTADGLQEEKEDPFELLAAQDTPALRLWGRPGREYIRLLNEASRCEFTSGFLNPLDRAHTLLAHVQHDILVRAPERETQSPLLEVDDSIQILACPTLRREVEVVADSIWAAIEASSDQAEPLRFHEIAVLVAETDRDRYLAHINDVFSARDRIPVRLLDQNLASRSAVFDLIQALLDLPRKVIDRDAITNICLHPNLQNASPLLQAQWSIWIRETKVMFGADSHDHEETYLDGQAYHWTQALDRLLLGHFLPAKNQGTQRLITLDNSTLAPFETPPEDRGSLAIFVQTVRDCLVDAQAIRTAELTLTQWSQLLGRVVNRYARADTPIDEVALGRCLRCIEHLSARDLDSHEFAYDIIHEMLTNELGRIENSRGRHRADGVVVSTLLPMRALPFKQIYVLGLGEGSYPTVDSPNPLDLRQVRRRAGDVNPAERDRYLFLETILAARTSLSLSYVARDQITGEALSPSPVIKELEFVLRPYIGAHGIKALTRHHPLASWSPQYFEPGTHRLNSRYADAAFGFSQLPKGWTQCVPEAIETGDGSGVIGHFGWVEPPTAERVHSDNLSLSAMRGFLLSPLQQSAKTVLGLYADETVTAQSTEPITMSTLDRLSLLQSVFWSDVQDEAALNEAYDLEFNRLYLQNKAPAGPFATAVKTRDFEILKQWRTYATSVDAGPLESWERWAFGACEETIQITRQCPAISFQGNPDNQVKIRGVLERMHPDRHLFMTPILNEKAVDKHFLRALLSVIALRAGGIALPDTVKVVIPVASKLAMERVSRNYRVPSQDWALQWINDIVEDLNGGFHAYRLPYEVVMNWYRARLDDSEAQIFLGATQRTSDDFGPIDDLSPFTLPGTDAAGAMVQARFDLLFRMTIS